ncbi:MAG: hypothetical protein ACTHNP_02000 [Solirubrobacterales bacterium]
MTAGDLHVDARIRKVIGRLGDVDDVIAIRDLAKGEAAAARAYGSSDRESYFKRIVCLAEEHLEMNLCLHQPPGSTPS